jgi:hypothetical protein
MENIEVALFWMRIESQGWLLVQFVCILDVEFSFNLLTAVAC